MWQHSFPCRRSRSRTRGEVGPRLRQLRDQKGLSARQVAGLAGLTPAYLSRLENGRVSPTVATLARLVEGMGETMATLFQEPPGVRETVVRRADRHLLRSRGVLDSQVTPGWAKRLEILESLVEPGQGSSDDLHTHAGEEECVLVLDGQLDLYPRRRPPPPRDRRLGDVRLSDARIGGATRQRSRPGCCG